jgi:glutamyl-tRNA reductase
MSIIVVGTNFRRAPIHVRERVARIAVEHKAVLKAWCGEGFCQGFLLVNTCGRSEFYVDAADPVAWHDRFSLLWGADWQEFFYWYEDLVAVEHIFRTAAGLDSAVVGECEIQGQMKEAFKKADQDRSLSPRLMRVVERAFFAASLARTSEDIMLRPASLAASAAQCAAREVCDISSARVFILGAGVVARGVVEQFSLLKARCVVVANRTFSRACVIAEEFNARAAHFDAFYQDIMGADIIVSATASPHPVLQCEHLVGLQKAMVILDLAVPRDVDPAVGGLPGVKLFTVDDIAPDSCLEQGSALRRVTGIVDEKASIFWQKEMGREKALWA